MSSYNVSKFQGDSCTGEKVFLSTNEIRIGAWARVSSDRKELKLIGSGDRWKMSGC